MADRGALSLRDEFNRAAGLDAVPEFFQGLTPGEDVAAENEVASLNHYFVRTGQYVDARKGHARFVIGRKVAG
jgi:hypothetical protein